MPVRTVPVAHAEQFEPMRQFLVNNIHILIDLYDPPVGSGFGPNRNRVLEAAFFIQRTFLLLKALCLLVVVLLIMAVLLIFIFSRCLQFVWIWVGFLCDTWKLK